MLPQQEELWAHTSRLKLQRYTHWEN